ncbi:HlyD family efflux transporter periplasmic adaptor subunit [Microbulbifer salipaludis]|uniref:HlyD family efflux transporter periplasmic adaptor subunit n=1 Tax=Microbulbifer salipaludis TaxID=187980 RepID=A0ABS3E8L5_9GAMM|nr:HlyD family efflux transporter periplasmic adaptor subunit [Microbulbifer salipaludis]MBN8431625.1 HlyD family efflux transporter periplasmic adaptor subunit [Microbulbifer salipaludis]
MGHKLFKRITGLLIVLGLLAFFIYAFSPKPVPVDMTEVSRGPMQVAVSDEGYTRVHDVFVVSAPVTGYLLRIQREVGDAVETGATPLVELLPTHPQFLDERGRSQAQAAIRSAEAALKLSSAERRDAEARLNFARADARRARKLGTKGHISQVEVERIELALDSAEAARDTARAAEGVSQSELENARAALIEPQPGAPLMRKEKLVQVTAPVSGRVLRLLQESERVVPVGTPLLEIGNPAELEIVIDLLSRDAVRVQPSAPVKITNWGGDAPLHGRVRLIEPFGFTKISALGIEEQRVNVIVDFVDPKDTWSRLGHGYRVDAAIETWRADDVVQVPTGALFRHQKSWALFRVMGGRAVRTEIEVGHNNGQMAEVLSGVTPGEVVVLHPSERIADGVKVVRRTQLGSAL